MAPVLGGALYEKTGHAGVFGLASGVLALDFMMRLLIVEKKTAAKYTCLGNGETNTRDSGTRNEDGERDAGEADPLLPRGDEDTYKIRDQPGKVLRTLPILICFRDPRLVVALVMAFVQAALLALFDATIPTEATDLFGFSSLKAGLLFIAIDVPYLILGPLAGWAVDRFGTKPAAAIGFAYLVPTLVLLRLPSERPPDSSNKVILYSSLLALNGGGLAIIGSAGIVEASDVVRRYDAANPGLFGANGPYAQLYGFNSVFFSLGLTVGPLAAGALRDSVGYGNMNLVFAVMSGVTSVLAFSITGGRPAILARLIEDSR